MSNRSTFVFKALSIVVFSLATSVVLPGDITAQETMTEFASKDPGLKPMFLTDSFDGWVRLGGKAKYEIKDGIVTGTCVKGEPNSFMCTGMDYGNFVLELEFKVDAAMNSGIQIRSQCFAHPTTFTKDDGKKIKIPARRVHGYQVEIDPSERRWSGGIYDEARRAWLDDLDDTPEAKQAFKPDGWNHYRIECNGDRIRTWVNGVAAANLVDNKTPAGFIALQVHGAYRKTEMIGTTVQWRNIRIKVLDETKKK